METAVINGTPQRQTGPYFEPISKAQYLYDYVSLVSDHQDDEPEDRVELWRQICRTDLFGLLYFGLGRRDLNHPWLVARCNEVQAEHHSTLDLWAREHYKSTILTYGLILQELICNPSERIVILSHTRPSAKSFLRQIMHTLQQSPPLVEWFPDVFFSDPRRQAPKWSEDDGIIIRREGAGQEPSVSAWGLVDGQPVGRHYTIRVYDDVVTPASCTTPEMIAKTRDAYELSHSLGTDGGTHRVIGTRYHHGDLYGDLIRGGAYHVRTYPATRSGTIDGDPVLLSQERLAELRRVQGPYTYSCQQLLDPIADSGRRFSRDWLRYYEALPENRRKFCFVDPANSKSAHADYTVMAVVSVDSLGNRYVEDLVRERMDLGERWRSLKALILKHGADMPVYYEQYGLQADIQHHEHQQRHEGVYFALIPIGGKVAKSDRIERLIPVMEQGRFYLPLPSRYREIQSVYETLVEEELLTWPASRHDDMLDAISRIEDPAVDARGPVAVSISRTADRFRQRQIEAARALAI